MDRRDKSSETLGPISSESRNEVPGQTSDMMGTTGQGTGGSRSSLLATIGQHPVAAALIGAGLGLLLVGVFATPKRRQNAQGSGKGKQMSAQKTLITWLNNAHATEHNLAKVLERHARSAKNQPEMQARFQQHLQETRHHAEMVKGCIERLGGRTSVVKSGMGAAMGMVQGVSTAVAEDEIIKNLLGDYASEHFEIASYRSLIAAAEELGDQETAGVCRQILRDEEEMARWLEGQIPTVTRIFLSQKTGAEGYGAS